MSTSSSHRVLVIVLLVIGVPALLFGVYKLTLGRSVLAGPVDHDFGVVALVAPEVTVEHVFRLVNRSRSTIELGEVRSSCGCTVPQVSTKSVAPGEELAITAVMTLTKSGLTTARITVEMQGRGVRHLNVRAIGKPLQHLRPARPSILIEPEVPETVMFFLDLWDGEDPSKFPEPALAVTSDALRAELVSWGPYRDANAAQGHPAIWRGQITVTCKRAILPSDAAIAITFGRDQALMMPVQLKMSRPLPTLPRDGEPESNQPAHDPGFNPLKLPSDK